jgi:hypothetical protein
MKKSDLKDLIKPLVKECIHEVLIEEGHLSSIVSEVARGMQGNLMVESTQVPPTKDKKLFNENHQMKRQIKDSKSRLSEHRKRLMDAIGTDAYNGVNVFEGVDPANAPAEPKPGSVDLGNPGDSGVDISSLMGGVSQIWKAIK